MEEKTGQKSRLIHCITNPVSMNQCANTILALDARPIMAEHPDEVAEITRTASSLMLNLGSITEARITSMRISLREANGIGIPVTLDAVGTACSTMRRTLVKLLLSSGRFAVIKGNCSEIIALYDDTYKASGVDAKEGTDEDLVMQAALAISAKYKTIVAATGKTDIIASNGEIRKIEGGTSQLSQVTGTGCMLGAVIATYLADKNDVQSVADACAFFKRCGAKAQTDKGIGTFMVNLLDALGEKNGI